MSAPVAPQNPSSLTQDQLITLINQSRQFWKCSWIGNITSIISDFFTNDIYSQYRQGPWLVLPYNKIIDIKLGDIVPTAILFDSTVTNTTINGDIDFTSHPLSFYSSLVLPDNYKYDSTIFPSDGSSVVNSYVYPCDQGMYWEVPRSSSTSTNYITFNISTGKTGSLSSRGSLSKNFNIPFKYIKIDPNTYYDIPNLYSTASIFPDDSYNKQSYELINKVFSTKKEEYDFINKCRKFWKLNWRYNLEESGILLPSQDYTLPIFDVYPYTEIKDEFPDLDNSKAFYDFDPSVINTKFSGYSLYTQRPSTFSKYMKITESVDLYKDYKTQQLKDSNDHIQGGDSDNIPTDPGCVIIDSSGSMVYPTFHPQLGDGYAINIPKGYVADVSNQIDYTALKEDGVAFNLYTSDAKPLGHYAVESTTPGDGLSFGLSNPSTQDISSVQVTIKLDSNVVLTSNTNYQIKITNTQDTRVSSIYYITVNMPKAASVPTINPDTDPNAPAKYSPFLNYISSEDTWKTSIRYKLAGGTSLSKSIMHLFEAYMSVIAFYNTLETNKGRFDLTLLNDPYFLPDNHPIFDQYTLKVQEGMAIPPYFLNNTATRFDVANIDVKSVVDAVKQTIEIQEGVSDDTSKSSESSPSGSIAA